MIFLLCVIGVLCILCIVQALYICRAKRQLSEWLYYLESVKNAPEQKSFVKGKGILAEINYGINGILDGGREQLLKLERAEEANKQILANLSHDVRTPLASLTGYLEALEQGRAKGEAREEYIHVAYKKALDLKGLVDILFDWFKINSHEWEYQIREYDVNELTRQAVIGYLPILEGEKIRIVADIPEEEWVLPMDKIAYGRIMNNLLGNAVKHGKCSKIVIKVQKGKDMVVIKIANDGTAIPREELPYIFERLYKCDSSRSQGGNGLGLAIVKELVSAMRGTVTAQSREGETSFSIAFPLLVREK